MNTQTIVALIAVSVLTPQLAAPARAQGSLVPPAGPPAAVMKSLHLGTP